MPIQAAADAMRLRFALASAAALMAAMPVQHAAADALPMPMEMNEFQQLLAGTWREQGAVQRQMLGHGAIQRTIAFGNDSAAMLIFGSLSYANEYNAGAMVGRWSAERVDARTVKVTFTQSETRGTVWTLIFEGDDAFTFSDEEMSAYPPSRFVRLGAKVTPNETP